VPSAAAGARSAIPARSPKVLVCPLLQPADGASAPDRGRGHDARGAELTNGLTRMEVSISEPTSVFTVASACAGCRSTVPKLLPDWRGRDPVRPPASQ
jgi:hypothetical protein